ncbi:MAG: DUF2970 domain-containing protein [Candidatus Berkiellales bacterium]
MSSSPPSQKPTFWQMVLSVLAAMFGVQSAKARERDFSGGNPWVFIVLGIIAVALFVLILVGIVMLVLSGTKVR